MEVIVKFVYDNILSIAMMVALMFAGIFITVKMRAFQFTRFGYSCKNTIGGLFDKKLHTGKEGSVSPFQAVTTALAGTIGTGSIAGVATAIVAGGPGAIFWMWISALLGMITKYSEIVLSLTYREKNEKGAWVGGPMYYIKNGLGIKWLAAVFAVFAMIACLGTGNAVQSNSISGVLEESFKIPTWVTGLVLVVLVSAVILGGVKRIASVNEKLVPIMAVFFIIASILALIFNASSIPTAFALIFKEAFNFKAIFGGVAGYGIFSALRYGVARGVFSNEAGLGSAPIAHAASSAEDPVKQGLWGIFEVFITTIVICTMTALVILSSDTFLNAYDPSVKLNLGAGIDGARFSALAFGDALSYIGTVVISVSTVFFALSTILGWGYYGEVCATYLFPNKSEKAVLVYRLIYIVFVFVGAVADIGIVWALTDCFNVLMALPNLIAIIALSGVVKNATVKHFAAKKAAAQESEAEKN